MKDPTVVTSSSSAPPPRFSLKLVGSLKMDPEDVYLRMPQPALPIGNCSLDLSQPPPVRYHVDPVEIEEGRVRERMAWEVIKPGEPSLRDPAPLYSFPHPFRPLHVRPSLRRRE